MGPNDGRLAKAAQRRYKQHQDARGLEKGLSCGLNRLCWLLTILNICPREMAVEAVPKYFHAPMEHISSAGQHLTLQRLARTEYLKQNPRSRIFSAQQYAASRRDCPWRSANAVVKHSLQAAHKVNDLAGPGRDEGNPPRRYTVGHILKYVGDTRQGRVVVRWYGLSSHYNPIGTSEHAPQHAINHYLKVLGTANRILHEALEWMTKKRTKKKERINKRDVWKGRDRRQLREQREKCELLGWL